MSSDDEQQDYDYSDDTFDDYYENEENGVEEEGKSSKLGGEQDVGNIKKAAPKPPTIPIMAAPPPKTSLVEEEWDETPSRTSSTPSSADGGRVSSLPSFSTSHNAVSTVVPAQVLQKMQRLIFGTSSTRLPRFTLAWMQGFNFRKLKPPQRTGSGSSQRTSSVSTQLTGNYGLLQTEGGPCGIIASVQAYICFFLFHVDEERERVYQSRVNVNRRKKALPLHYPCLARGEKGIEREVDDRDKTNILPILTDDDQNRLLTLALARILWRCALAKSNTTTTAHVLLLRTTCDVKTGYPSSGAVVDYAVTDEENLCRLIYSNLIATSSSSAAAGVQTGFRSPWGCVLLLLSALVSRGVDDVEKDMNFPIPLIDEHWYCTQELTNMLVVGRALGNVMDDDDNSREVASLKGVSVRADVGQLSIFEVNDYIVVGHNLKYPATPIWIINFESHYCVVFSPDRLKVVDDMHTNNTKKPWDRKLFDVYFYDQQGKNVEEVRLTVGMLSYAAIIPIPTLLLLFLVIIFLIVPLRLQNHPSH